MREKKNQGRYHLIALFLVPINVACFLLTDNLIVPGLILGLSVFLIFWILTKI